MTTTLSIRIDRDLKEDVEELLDDLGLNITTAITCFFKKTLALDALPFAISRHKKTPNAETIAAMEEGDRIVNDPNRKHFKSLDDLWEDLEK